jgi:hypothetical protein
MARDFPTRQYLTDLGRIRIGTSKPSGKGKTPVRLDTFRLTSQDRTAIEQASRLYGGEVQPWQGAGGISQWQVITQANTLRVIVQGTRSIHAAYEVWEGETCLQRCDGQCILSAARQELKGMDCQCTDGHKDACKLVIRMACTLPDVASYGLWRLDSHGINATADLLGVARFLTARGMPDTEPFAAHLRLEQRRSGGRTVRVPTLALSQEALGWRPAPAPTLGQAMQAADDLFGDRGGMSLAQGSQRDAPEPDDDDTHEALIAQIEVVLLAGGTTPEKYWPKVCAAWVLESPRHLTVLQLQQLYKAVRAQAAQKEREGMQHAGLHLDAQPDEDDSEDVPL